MTTKVSSSVLSNTSVTPGTYGGIITLVAAQVPVITVDQQGRLTSAANVAIASTYVVANTGQITANASVGVVALGLATSGVTAGTYGSSTTIPYITVDDKGRVTSASQAALSSSQVTTALGYTPYNSTNPNGYITGITSTNVTTALGYTPYNSTNPNGYISSVPNASTQVSSLGVGTAASGTAGEIRATNDITAFYTSDISFKENVQPIEDALSKVVGIGGKTYDWKDSYLESKGGEDGYFVRKNDFGVIAQDVEREFPLAVRQKPDGTLAVDYEKMCALAFQAIIELKSKVEELEGKIK